MARWMVSTEDFYRRFRWRWTARRYFERLSLSPNSAAVLAKLSKGGVLTLVDMRESVSGEAQGFESYGFCKLPLDFDVQQVEVRDD